MALNDLLNSIYIIARCETPDAFIRRIEKLDMNDNKKAEVCYWLVFNKSFINKYYADKLRWVYSKFKDILRPYMKYARNHSRVLTCFEHCGMKSKKYIDAFQILCEVSIGFNLTIISEVTIYTPAIQLKEWAWEYLIATYNRRPTAAYIKYLSTYTASNYIKYLNSILPIDELSLDEINGTLIADKNLKTLPLELISMIAVYTKSNDSEYTS